MNPILAFFSSLRLTVVLLSLSMVLIFFGTLDQVHWGIWHTQKMYFESFVVLSPVVALLNLFITRDWNESLAAFVLPLPGGYTLGTLLFFNLAAAHAVRFQLSWKKSGIFLTHLGLLALLLGELLTDLYAKEGRMWLHENGPAVNYSESYRDNELVLIDRTEADFDRVYAIPQSRLRSGRFFDDQRFPFIVEILEFFPNSRLLDGSSEGPASPNLATSGFASRVNVVVVSAPVTYSESETNTVTAYVRLRTREGQVLGTWLTSNVIDDRYPPQTFTHQGRTYEVAMRYARKYYPFHLRLIEFSHDRYPGTEIPRNFSSLVEIIDPERSAGHTSLIYMNSPLRYSGNTFYQASFAEQDTASMLQVVRNPGWTIPYFGVSLVGLGLTVQFGIGLSRGLSRSRTPKPTA
ncbi:MAG: cytochrome c biogenesis protein ResB [Puniceicoccaceae bacterium]